jgi:hypothetical protein
MRLEGLQVAETVGASAQESPMSNRIPTVALATALFSASCGGASAKTSATSPTATATVKMAADFSAPAVNVSMLTQRLSTRAGLLANTAPTKQTSCPTPAPSNDGPIFAAGLDCDRDGGAVSYLTPSVFRVAVKRLGFVMEDGSRTDLIADSGTLATAQVVDLTTTFTLPEKTLPAGNYSHAELELYFFELQMPINNADEVVGIRIYLSDDDFPAEGNLGHHQGDITFVDRISGQELGFVKPGEIWKATNLSPTRTMESASVDPQTGHHRGLFGDPTLWDATPFMQGPSRDVFAYQMSLGLQIPASGNPTVTISFPVKDSWYWEDFDGDGKLGPCLGTPPNSDACMAGAEWAPLFNPPQLASP